MDEDAQFSDEYVAEMLAEYKTEKKTPSEMFNDWLYERYMIGNGHMLLNYYEDGDIQATFLDEMGLPEDTEL